MANATYNICIDWNNDGDFLDAYENVNKDVRFIKYKRGKTTRLGSASPGELELRLNNMDGKYSPSNASSPIYTNLKLGRPVRVQAVYDAVTYDLFYGYISEIAPHPHLAEQDCYMRVMDGKHRLRKAELTLDLLQNKKTGFIFGAVLDAIDWPAGKRKIDAGQDTIPFAWWSEVKADEALCEIEESERGYYFVDGEGDVVWQDRSFRNYQTSQATINYMTHIVPVLNDEEIVNDARVTFTKREITEVITLWEQAWSGTSRPKIMPQETYEFTVEYGGVGVDVITPVRGVDEDWHCETEIHPGETDLFAELTFTKYAEGALVAIKNTGLQSIHYLPTSEFEVR